MKIQNCCCGVLHSGIISLVRSKTLSPTITCHLRKVSTVYNHDATVPLHGFDGVVAML